jgi:hypothetical protein
VLASPAAAHEAKTVGNHFVIGFGDEPAYASEKNSVQLLLADANDKPVTDLTDTLKVAVTTGSADPLHLAVEVGESSECRRAGALVSLWPMTGGCSPESSPRAGLEHHDRVRPGGRQNLLEHLIGDVRQLAVVGVVHLSAPCRWRRLGNAQGKDNLGHGPYRPVS